MYDFLRLNYQDLLQPTSAVRNRAASKDCGQIDMGKIKQAQQKFFGMNKVQSEKVR